MEVTISFFRFLINFRYLKCYNIRKYIYIFYFNINNESNLNSKYFFLASFHLLTFELLFKVREKSWKLNEDRFENLWKVFLIDYEPWKCIKERQRERELKTSLKIQGEAGFIHEIIQAGNLQRSRKLLFMRNIIWDGWGRRSAIILANNLPVTFAYIRVIQSLWFEGPALGSISFTARIYRLHNLIVRKISAQ